ncbi:hypothetical protein Q9L58_003387 [Maublancomyces gigas]|uniref:Uncharacterized protein n=1 Tax=Discina gigas TaxID=1032678 RepID=A0ABR3GP06_9PEZI
MSTNFDHAQSADTADHRRQLILVVSGNASPQIAECLASEIGTDYIGGATILRGLEESTNKAEELAHEALKVSTHTGIAILALPETGFPLKMFRDAVPKDVDVRFILCDGAARERRRDEQSDRDGLRCLTVDVNKGNGGVEAVVRKIEQEVWGAGSEL